MAYLAKSMVYAAKNMEERVAKTKDLEKRGWVLPGEFEEYLFRDGPDPLLLAEGRVRLAVSEDNKRSESESWQSADEQELPPGTIQACQARSARMGGRVKSAVR
jgi:hypothetical protein